MMLKLISMEAKGGTKWLLRFSDGAWGVFDAAPLVDASAEMTTPLRDPVFFARATIEAGALAWPNGFDLSAESLHRHLKQTGDLHRDAAAA